MRWLTERANRLVYGERVAPDEALRTLGSRLTRAIPLDELLLQLAETLRKSMAASAEIWTGPDGHYELAAVVPHRQPAPVAIGAKERAVVARAGVSAAARGSTSGCRSWSADRAARRRASPRSPTAASCSASSSSTRRRDGEPFTEEDDRVLTELARQVGLALHNVQLDTALQACLDELRQTQRRAAASRGLASSPPATPSAASSSATSTTAPSSTSSRWPSSCASPRTRSRTTPTTPMAMIDEIQRRPAGARSPSCARWPTASSRRC